MTSSGGRCPGQYGDRGPGVRDGPRHRRRRGESLGAASGGTLLLRRGPRLPRRGRPDGAVGAGRLGGCGRPGCGAQQRTGRAVGTGPDRSDRAGRGIAGSPGPLWPGPRWPACTEPGVGSASGAGSTRELTSGPDGSPVAAPGGGPDAEPAAAGTTGGDPRSWRSFRAAPARRSKSRRFAHRRGRGRGPRRHTLVVLTLLRSGAEDPSLSTTWSMPPRRSVPDAPGSAAAGIGDRLLSVPFVVVCLTLTYYVTSARSARRSPPPSGAPRNVAGRPRRQTESAEGSTAGSERAVGSGPAALPAAGAAQVAGEGIRPRWRRALAGGRRGRKFTSSSLGENWTAYDGPGHDGRGRRTPDAVSVEDGNLVIRGDSGATPAASPGAPAQVRQVELRASSRPATKQYHPVLLLWPGARCPGRRAAEVIRRDQQRATTSFFPCTTARQLAGAREEAVDITKWNNYAVRWTPDAIVGYISQRGVVPVEDPAHAAARADARHGPAGRFPPTAGRPSRPRCEVAWMRQYS
ncbi:hypothetical protein HBB16_05105 [Pseudonocardia sp. MCCB 268]|nr:hypothetical protein [Pseudonocardia cytotoxica]